MSSLRRVRVVNATFRGAADRPRARHRLATVYCRGNLIVAAAVERDKSRLYAQEWPTKAGRLRLSCEGGSPMHYYGLRAALLAGVMCSLCLLAGSVWFGMAGLAVASGLIFALGWTVYFHSERAVLTAIRARPVGEVEHPELYRLVRELCYSARLPVPRLFVSPA